MGRLRGFCWPCGGSCDVILFQKVGTTQCLKCVRACLKDHPCHLYVPLCAGSVPHSASAVRCASFMCFIFSTDPPQIVMCSRHKNFLKTRSRETRRKIILFILATKSSIPILGQVAYILGWLMDAIFKVLDNFFEIENIGLCIIIFSVIVYLMMTP